jgi:hypothetical protein
MLDLDQFARHRRVGEATTLISGLQRASHTGTQYHHRGNDRLPTQDHHFPRQSKHLPLNMRFSLRIEKFAFDHAGDLLLQRSREFVSFPSAEWHLAFTSFLSANPRLDDFDIAGEESERITRPNFFALALRSFSPVPAAACFVNGRFL